MSARGIQTIARLIFVSALISGCRGRAATADDCGAVLDRLVELELTETGFHDPAIAERWKQSLRVHLALELDRCKGRRVPIDLRACLSRVHRPEEITHHCLQ
jgi:hypothetical protein